jgi:thioredoxin-like negative regulator of GroEL
MLQSDPANEDAQNDFALLSLLTMKESQKAETMARALFQKHPQNSAYASTYAFALYLKGESREAQQILDGLPAPREDEQSLAAYYAIILAANHDESEAAHYASLARGAHLLPEEKRLLLEAVGAAAQREPEQTRPPQK